MPGWDDLLGDSIVLWSIRVNLVRIDFCIIPNITMFFAFRPAVGLCEPRAVDSHLTLRLRLYSFLNNHIVAF